MKFAFKISKQSEIYKIQLTICSEREPVVSSRVVTRPHNYLDRPEIAATIQKKEEDISE